MILVINSDAVAIEKGHAPSGWARRGGGAAVDGAARLCSVQGRERGWYHQHVLLLDNHVRPPAGGRRPDALGPRLLADAEAIARVLVGPDMAPFVEPAEFRIPGAHQRRELGARLDMRAPAVDYPRDTAWFKGIDADLVEAAVLTRLERRRERRREINVGLLVDDEFPDIGRPALKLGRFGTLAGAGTEIVIGPEMDHPVERANLGVPKGGERGDLGPHRQSLGETLLEGGDSARLQRVGAHLDDHRISSVSGVSRA